jgi:hypothetical protein
VGTHFTISFDLESFTFAFIQVNIALLLGWNWIWLSFYLGAATLQSYKTIQNPKREDGLIDRVQRTLFGTVNPISWFVTIIYWALLSGQIFAPGRSAFSRFNDVMLHVMNLFIPLLDLFLSRTVIQWIHLGLPLVVTLAYQILIICWHLLISPGWPYPFLNAINGGKKEGIMWIPMLVFAASVFAGLALFFALTRWFITLRDKYLVKKEVEVV